MSVPSVSTVVSSGSSAQAPATPDVADGAADNSPFALLLAAISAADPDLQFTAPPDSSQPQSGETQRASVPAQQASVPAQGSVPRAPHMLAANDDDADAGPQSVGGDTAPLTDASLVPPPTGESAPKSGLKPDKKSDAGKTAIDDATIVPTAQTLILQQLPVPLVAQAAVQIQSVAGNDDQDDTAGPAGIGSTGAAPPAQTANDLASKPAVPASTVAPAVPQTDAVPPQAASPQPSSSVDDANPTRVMTAAQSLSAANDNDSGSDALKDLIAAPQAIPAVHRSVGGLKAADASAAGKTAASQALQQPALQTPPTDDDGDTAASQPVSAGPDKPQAHAAVAPPPTAGNTAQSAPQADMAPAKAPDAIQNFHAISAAAADNNGDGKASHAAATAAQQPDLVQSGAPQPPAHAAPVSLQANAAITLGNANAPAGPSSNVHIAIHDANTQTASVPTPNTDALAVSIAARSLSGSKQFDIRLDPPELGRVEVRLSIDASGKTQAHMTADQPRTLELLQKDAPTLTRALRDAGLDVSQSGLNFSLKGQGQHPGQNNGGQNGNFAPGRGLSLPVIAQSIEAAQSAGTFSSLPGSVRLDIHV